MFKYAYNLIQDEQKAQDIVQDIWLDFWERKELIENQNIKAYLYNAVKYKVFREIKNSKFSNQRIEDLNLIYEDFDYEESKSYSMSEILELAENKLSILPEKCKQVFKLSRIEGLKNKEIAQKLFISEKTVENHITKALKSLNKSFSLFISLF